MTKFNKTTIAKDTTENYEGAVAYSLTPELELYSAVVTSMLSNKFYESESDNLERIQKLIHKVSPEFVAKLAIYAREKMYLRSIPLVLVTELAKIHNGDNLVSKAVSRVVSRADEITELLSYYALANKRSDTKKLGKLSTQIKKGLEYSFNKFDEYNFAKYNRKREVTLKDALFIVHPTAITKEQQELFNKIVTDTLTIPDTWETQLGKTGDKKAEWEGLIDRNSLGYMALLRNLRNILEAKVSQKHLEVVAKKLSSKEEVVKSKQFPFRFLSAYREVKDTCSGKAGMILDALEDAMLASAENINGFNYDTSVLLACDVSGSMQSSISERSKVEQFDIGLTLAMLLRNRCKNVITGMFGSEWKRINVPKQNILANIMEFHRREGEVGYSTNGYLVIKELIAKKEKIDKIMIFTDCQLWDSSSWNDSIDMKTIWNEYKKISPDSRLYLFDLAGYGNTPLSIQGNNVYLVAGWSDKIFDMLTALEEGSSVLKEIEKIEL